MRTIQRILVCHIGVGGVAEEGVEVFYRRKRRNIAFIRVYSYIGDEENDVNAVCFMYNGI